MKQSQPAPNYSKAIMLAIWLTLCVGVIAQTGSAPGSTTVAGRIVDGAGRPVEGAEVMVLTSYPGMPHLVRSYDEFRGDKGEIADLLTDKEGNFRITTTYSLDKIRIAIGKKGYVGFTKSAASIKWDDPLVIYKSVTCKNIESLERVDDDQVVRSSLVEILASDEFDDPFIVQKNCYLVPELFRINRRITPVLRTVVDNRALLPRTARLLSYFAEEQDRQLLISALENRKDLKNEEINRARQFIAGGLTAPTSEREWRLLESIITCERRYVDDNDPVDVPVEEAALALAANGSARALLILKSKPQYERPPASESAVNLAIKWIEKHPGHIEARRDLEASVKSASRIFNYSGKPERFKIDKIVMDKSSERALIFCTVDAGGEYYLYELVFGKKADIWILRGIWPSGVVD